MLNKAHEIAKRAHEGQFDKGGNPYILHPLAVSGMVETEAEKTVALLHDVIEDTIITLEELRSYGFPDQVIKAVDVLTKRPGVSYDDYIEKVKQNPLALTVKIADMSHNKDLSRISQPTEKDFERANRYEKKIKELLGIEPLRR